MGGTIAIYSLSVSLASIVKQIWMACIVVVWGILLLLKLLDTNVSGVFANCK